jgi:hypothetical protein
MRLLQRVWDAVRAWYFFVKPIRFVLIPLVLLLWALIWAAEGQDAVRALVEVDRNCARFGRLLFFLLVTFGAALEAWYWSRQLLRVRTVAGDDDRENARKLLPRILGVSVFLIAIVALGRAAWLGYAGQIDFSMQVTIGTIAALIVLGIVFVIFVILRRKKIGPSPRVDTHLQLDGVTRAILGTTVAVAAIFVILTAVWPLAVGSAFQSPSLLMLSAALWAGLGSWLAYWFDTYRVPLASTFLICAVVFSCFNDNHAVRTLTVAEGGAAPKPRLTVDETFNAWYGNLAAKYPNEARHPVFLVATEGGGIRAAYWTAAVLSAIQDRAPDFAPHLFAISSVSGGSVGATVFTALVADTQRSGTVGDCPSDQEPGGRPTVRFAAQQMLSYDALAPTLASLLHADLVQRFLPIGFIPDRAKALETGWERGWRTHIRANNDEDNFFSTGLLKMYADRQGALLPSLFLNGTSVENGNRIIASNCDLSHDGLPDAVDIFTELGRDMRLSTAAHGSARFTYVSPAGSIHANGGGIVGHVVDGGYFENSGAQTAADVMNRLTLIKSDRPFDLYLILIKFQKVIVDPGDHCKSTPAPGRPPEKFMNELMSPLRSLLATRGARAVLAFEEAKGSSQLRKPAFEFLLTETNKGIVLPLGWLLARRTRNAIDLQVGPVTPPGVDCAVRPFVDANVVNLNAIAGSVAPQLAPPALDPVQKNAVESEKDVKKK